MASGVEIEEKVAAAFGEAPVRAVQTTRPMKLELDDLFLRTGSGRAKKNGAAHHIVNLAVSILTGMPKDAVINARVYGALVAGKVSSVARAEDLYSSDGSLVSETVVTRDMRAKEKPYKPNALLGLASDNLVTPPNSDPAARFPEGQPFRAAMVDVLVTLKRLSKTRDLNLGLSPDHPNEYDIEVWLTLRPMRRATIVHRFGSKMTIRRSFDSAQPRMADGGSGFTGQGRSTFEVIEWPALVAMANLVHLEDDQENLSDSNPPLAEGGAGDVETSAAQKTKAVEAPPSTASDSLTHLQTGYQTSNKRSNKSSTLAIASLPHQEKGLGMLGVNAGFREVNHL